MAARVNTWTFCLAALVLAARATCAADAPATFLNAPAAPLPRALRVTVDVPTDPAAVDTGVRAVKRDLRRRRDLERLVADLALAQRLARTQDAYQDAHPRRVMPFAHDLSSKGKRRALDEAAALARQIADAPPADDRPLLHLAELLGALHNSARYPVKRSYQLIPEILPGLFLAMRAHRSVAPPAAGVAADVGDPGPSSFWIPRGGVAGLDLYAGFGRRSATTVAGVTCEYVEPKTGYGAHPGFHVRCGERDLRFKLGSEIYGGPFNTRIFDALGYRTFPIDDAPALRLRYDRRVLTEFHSRRLLEMRARLLFVTLFRHVVTDRSDAFTFIDHAEMKDGRTVTGAQLRGLLLKDPRPSRGRPHPEAVNANYRPEVEAAIEALVFQPGTIAGEPEDVRPVGPWDYDQLDHFARREVRGVFVLAAWLDEDNMRWENTRLAYRTGGGQAELVHLFSDVGSGLGLARDLRHSRNSDVEAMPWEVTERLLDGRVRFSGYAPNVDNRAFAQMTWGDALWMVRRLAAFSEEQILQALLATHMSAAEVRLALEKLVSKRQKMVLDFGLEREFPALAARRIDRDHSFDPADPAALRAVSLPRADGTVVTPPAGEWVVVRGHLARRVAPPAPQRPPEH